MAIPIIGEIWDGVRWVIDFFFNKAPKPITFLFFLVMLFLFSGLISFTIHILGVHCNSAGEPVKTSAFNIIDNIRLAFMDATDIYNASEVPPFTMRSPISVETSCYLPVCNISGDYYFQPVSPLCENQTILYPYLTKWEWWKSSQCVTCDGSTSFETISGAIFFTESETWCFGDAHSIPKEDMGWLQKAFCKPTSRCMPPPHYYYEYDTGLYTCEDLEFCGANLTNFTVYSAVDEELKNADAELLYPATMRKQDIRGAIKFNCDKELRPTLYFFGIPIFDFRLWLILALIFAMFMFLTNIGQQSKIP